MTNLTRQQKKWLSFLQTEQERQDGSYLEHSQYPEFLLYCAGCHSELKTSNIRAAIDFINDHPGHRAFSMEINYKPDALEYNRDVVLSQIVTLGTQIKAEFGEIDSLTQTRTTWLSISNGIDVGGAIERLVQVLKVQRIPNKFVYWAEAIERQDLRLIKHFTVGCKSQEGETDEGK